MPPPLQVFVTTPFQIICALCFAWTLYGMAGMRHGGTAIAKWGAIVTLVYLISVQVLHACAIAAPNQDTAFMMSIVWTTVQMLVSTFFVNFSEVGGGASSNGRGSGNCSNQACSCSVLHAAITAGRACPICLELSATWLVGVVPSRCPARLCPCHAPRRSRSITG